MGSPDAADQHARSAGEVGLDVCVLETGRRGERDRAFAAKMRSVAPGSPTSAARPYTVSVGMPIG